MLLNLLSRLHNNLTRVGLFATPQQMALSAQYVLSCEDIAPDPDIEFGLKPILVTNVENANKYHLAWERMRSGASDVYDVLNPPVDAKDKHSANGKEISVQDIWERFLKDNQKGSSDKSEQDQLDGEGNCDKPNDECSVDTHETDKKPKDEGKNTRELGQQSPSRCTPTVNKKARCGVDGVDAGDTSFNNTGQTGKQENKSNNSNKSKSSNNGTKPSESGLHQILLAAIAKGESSLPWKKKFEEDLQKKFLGGDPSTDKFVENGILFKTALEKAEKEWARFMKSLSKSADETYSENTTLRGAVPFNTASRELDLRGMDDVEQQDFHHALAMLAERMRIRKEREMTARQGKLNLRKILRHSCRTFGEPIIISHSTPRKEPSRLVVLCDVSGSTARYTSTFLSFLHAANTSFMDVTHGFVFIDKAIDVSNLLAASSYQQLVTGINNAVNMRTYSDYGTTFEGFDAYAKNLLYQDTMLLILGDARNNHRASRSDILSSWKEMAKKVIWLNPESQGKWNSGDSIINEYKKCVHDVYDISTTKSMMSSLDSIFV